MNHKPVDQVLVDGSVVALVIRRSDTQNGIEFVTPGECSLQVGFMKRSAGHSVIPHMHLPGTRIIGDTQEFLFVLSGEVEIDFYSPEKKIATVINIAAGDAILLMAGGHGVRFIVESEVIEVKQGPHMDDKKRLL